MSETDRRVVRLKAVADFQEKSKGGDNDACRRWNRTFGIRTHDRSVSRVLCGIFCTRLHEPECVSKLWRPAGLGCVWQRIIRRRDGSLRLPEAIRAGLATHDGLVWSRTRSGPGSRFWSRWRSRAALVRLVGGESPEQSERREMSYA